MAVIAALALMHLVAGLVVALCFWRPRRLSDVPSAWVMTALTTFYGGPIGLGVLTGRIDRWTVGASGILAVGLAFAAWRVHPVSCFSKTDFREALRRMTRAEKALWGTVGLILLVTLGMGSILPIRAWDASEYHALNPMRWADSHRFQLDCYGPPDIDLHMVVGEVWPNVKGILPFLVLEFTGEENGTALAQWPFLVLLVACLFGLYKRLGLPGWAIPLGVLFCLVAPEMLLQSIEAYADLAFFAGQLAVVFLILVACQDGIDLRGSLLTGIAFALLSGTKPTALGTCGVLGAAYLAVVYWKSPEKVLPGRLRRVLAALAAALLLSQILSGPWYLHAIRKYGNPIYPIRVDIGGRDILPGHFDPDVASFYARMYQKKAGLAAWWSMMNESFRQPVLASWWSGLGAHALILGLPAAGLFLAAGWTSGRGRIYLPVVALFAVLFLTSPTKVLARLVLFELAFYGFAFAWLVTETTRRPRVILTTVFLALAAYNVFLTIPSVLYRPRLPQLVAYAMLTGHRRQAQVDTFPDEFTAVDYWREHVASDGKVVALSSGKPWLMRPANPRASVVRVYPYQEGMDVSAWTESLRAAGATHLYAPRTSRDFQAATRSPGLFRLLLHRVDSGAETSWAMPPSDEGALFEILPIKDALR